MADSCANCKFYIKEPLRPGYGECHAGRPTLFVIPMPQGTANLGGWPPTQEKLWCGEHKPRINGGSSQ
jgi:hypothetical protein